MAALPFGWVSTSVRVNNASSALAWAEKFTGCSIVSA
jgi:hypothetical protein